ncbi:oxidoreductase [Maudiozyma humilis]|uniref:Oxidoreductase n=1 Tax=Maudiozyma humilis TaxID=51915 RepID=A0AAV5RRV4_MAUHU|nr:oxidoreductase [Kazachstania humilis]
MFMNRIAQRCYATVARSSAPRAFYQKYNRQIKLAAAGTLAATVLGFAYCEWDIHTTWTIELDQDKFTRYRISQRVPIDPHHYILEVKPLSRQSVNIWKLMTSNKIWSIEVKQPEIMIVRNYTPLPFKLISDKDSENYELEELDIANDDTNEGKLLFYVKNYDSGEVGRWMRHLDVGSRIDLRGPYVEYEIDQQKKNINIMTAGTGIVSALQILSQKPADDPVNYNWIHTSNDIAELGKLIDKVTALSKKSNVQLTLFDKKHDLRNNLVELVDLIPGNNNDKAFNTAFVSLVCGPEGFVKMLAGAKVDLNQGPIGGILKTKGWSNNNVFKL